MGINKVKQIAGGIAKDVRGQIRFVNDFDMSEVKRFYIIKNNNTDLVRGWRGHQIEKRWFYVLSGKFQVDLVLIDNWEEANKDLPVERVVLKENGLSVLAVPVGYATAFQALEEGSELLVFADYGIDNAKFDDHTWQLDYFVNRLD